MSDTIDENKDGPRWRWRWVAVGGLAVGLAAIVGLTVLGARGGDPCGGGPARRAGVWNEDLRERVRAAFGVTPWTAPTIAALDDTGTRWEQSFHAVCAATRAGEQTEAQLDARMRCLDRALGRYGALAAALAVPKLERGARTVATRAVEELPPPEACITRNTGEPSGSAAEDEHVIAAERELDKGWAALALGRDRDARDALAAADARLAGVNVPAVAAARGALDAELAVQDGNASTGARRDAALAAAAAAHASDVEIELWLWRLRRALVGGDAGDVVASEGAARAAAVRAGYGAAEIDALVAQALRDEGNLAPARTRIERALATTEPVRPDVRAEREIVLGSIEIAAGDAKAATEVLSRARDRVLSAFGDKHPDLARYDDALAAARRAAGQLREAMKLHAQSLELRTAVAGTDDPSVAESLLQRARTVLEGGDVDLAREDVERATKILERVHGIPRPVTDELAAVRAEIAAAAGEPVAPETPAPEPTATASPTIAPPTLAPLAPDELLSIERARALARHVGDLAHAGRTADARALATALRARWQPTLAPALAAPIGAALLAAGDRDTAAALLAPVAEHLPNEPSRTALAIFTLLAQSSPDHEAAVRAARAAVALYQAMPKLARGDDYAQMIALAGLH